MRLKIDFYQNVRQFISKYNEYPDLLIISREDYKELSIQLGLNGLTIMIPLTIRVQKPIFQDWGLPGCQALYSEKEIFETTRHREKVLEIGVKLLKSVGMLICKK